MSLGKVSTEYIFGSGILKRTIDDCALYRHRFESFRVVLLYIANDEMPNSPRATAARISMREKIRYLSRAGFHVISHVLPHGVSTEIVRNLCVEATNTPNVIAIGIQMPVPSNLVDAISIIGDKDHDAVNSRSGPFSICAAAEASIRLVSSCMSLGDLVAVVGSEGFVGKAIVYGLQKLDIQVLPLDKADDLRLSKEAKIVISAAGVPCILNERHISSSHNLVVDVGFSPIGSSIFLGDVSHRAYHIPQRLTPVPGGVGPLQMAILIERIAFLAGCSLTPWTYGLGSQTK